jgi:uncharacterized membrane protein
MWYGFTVVLFVVLVGFVVWAYPALPPNVPSHWNVYGEVDAYSDPLTSSILVPTMAALIAVLLIVFARYEKEPRVADALVAMSTVMMGFFVALHVVITLIALGNDLRLERFIAAFIGMLFIGIGRLMHDIPPNGYIGIRTYWTLQNPIVWTETHVLSARLMPLAGLIAIIGALLPIPAAYLFGLMLTAILLAVIIPTIYAYRRYHALLRG